MKNKIIYFVVIISIFFEVDAILAQDLIVKLKPEKIVCNYIDSSISISIKNNSNDTIFIALEPLNSDIVNSYEYRLFETFPFYYQPNRIVFFKIPNTGYFEALSSSNISYLRFPKILILAPNKYTEFIAYFGECIFNNIKDNNWEIRKKICYAFKKEINDVLLLKTEYLKKEFENSIIEKDTIKLNIMCNLQTLNKSVNENNVIRENVEQSIQICDSTLYYYKNSSYSRDSIYFRSSYDSIIYLFNHTIY